MRLARQPLCAFHPLAHLQVLLCLDQLSLELSNLVWLSRGTAAQLGDACVWGREGGKDENVLGWLLVRTELQNGREGRESGGRVEGSRGGEW